MTRSLQQTPAITPSSRHAWVRLAEVRRLRALLDQQRTELDLLRAETAELRATLRPWDGVEQKRALWALEDRAATDSAALARGEEQLVQLFTGLLLDEPCFAEAQSEFADLAWQLLAHAEERRDALAAERYLGLLGTYDDGRYTDLVEGTGTLLLQSEPGDAEVTLQRLELVDRRFCLTEGIFLGQTPVGPLDLAPGRYVAELSLPGFASVKRPFELPRGGHLHLAVRMVGRHLVDDAFVQVPTGRFQMGGDERAPGAGPAQSLFVENFAIGRHPVTVGEYRQFLDDLAVSDPASAIRHAPRVGRGPELDQSLPVTGVTFEAAERYCDWLSARTGLEHRLPTEIEWEKAARGVDGRAFPWGDDFDPSYCLMRLSRSGAPTLEPAGRFATDLSVYGVHDLAGGVAEWTSSCFDEGQAERVIRGGSFEDGVSQCRAAARGALSPEAARGNVGFRVVRSLPTGGGDTCSLPVVPVVEGGAPLRRPVPDLHRARQELLTCATTLATGLSVDEGLAALLRQTVRLVQAERGLVVSLEQETPTAIVSASASGGPLPSSDQQFDEQLVWASVRQKRIIAVPGPRPALALPLANGTSALVLERRFSGGAFLDEESFIAQSAADLLAVALRLRQVTSGPLVCLDGTLDEVVARVETELLSQVLVAEKRNISRTARRLGLSRNGLRARLRRYGLAAHDDGSESLDELEAP